MGDPTRTPGVEVETVPQGLEPVAPPPVSAATRRDWFWAALLGLAALILLSALISAVSNHAWLARYSPRLEVGVESASGLARLFGALVLFLFPTERGGERLRWVAAGLAVLGFGDLVFGYVEPLFNLTLNASASMYSSLAVRTLASALFVVGLWFIRPTRLTRRAGALIGLVFAAIVLGTVMIVNSLPPLAESIDLRAAAAAGDAFLPHLTTWHWALAPIPLMLSIWALAGALRDRHVPEFWLPVALILLAGSQLYTIFWPSAYSPVLTTADFLRLAFALVVLIGGLDAVRRIAGEHAVLLADARKHAERLEELGVLKANFTAMVAHELGNPLAAIRFSTQMLATGELTAQEQAETLRTIGAEADLLTGLVSDVSAAAAVERDDFQVKPRLVPLSTLLRDASAYARTLPGDHPLVAPFTATEMVWADPDRIAQVLRNLLSNAAKYSPEGRPIEIRMSRPGTRVRIDVVDRGYGIHPDDMVRVFQKFGRGRDQSGKRVQGIGLGLYLSRRIAQAHGTDLLIESELGGGTSIGFELEGLL